MSLPTGIVEHVACPRLPNELLAFIVRYAAADTKSLLQLRAVSSSLQELADSQLFEHVRLVPNRTCGEKVEGIQDPHIAQWVRTLDLSTAWLVSSSEDVAPLDPYIRLYARLDSFPRLQSLVFTFLGTDTRYFKAALASLGNSYATLPTPFKVPALSIFSADDVPPADCFASLPPVAFSQLSDLTIATFRGQHGSSQPDPALWTDVFPNRILGPTRHSLTKLNLCFYSLGWPLKDHPDLVFPQLRVLGLGNAPLGTVERHAESLVLRHATLQELRLDDCPMTIYPDNRDGAQQWAPFWDALREGLPVMQSVVLRSVLYRRTVNLHDGIERDVLEYNLQCCEKDSEKLYPMEHLHDIDWHAAKRLAQVLQKRRGGKPYTYMCR